MTPRKRPSSQSRIPLPVVSSAAPRPKRYNRFRAAVLASIYGLMAIHLVHWQLSGRTLAPLEFNEARHTLELGIVTAGFIFMLAAVASAAVVGRFFCGWGCHILALEDGALWLLRRLGIRPQPIRSRVLLWAPMGIMLYMFVWPQAKRLLFLAWPELQSHSGPMPEFDWRVARDSEGWASFITDDFWRNLPGPWVTVLTFLVCGFAVVYLLGSRTFCAYVCPYGALLGMADKVAVGRIRLTGECTKCGACTSACLSHVPVSHEVNTYGMVVSSHCFKDLDCVASCPEGALSFGFGKPSIFQKRQRNPKTTSRMRGWIREAFLLGVFVVVLAIFAGLPESMAPWGGRLYGVMPLFLSATLAVMTAFISWWLIELIRRRDVYIARWLAKSGGRLTATGIVIGSASAVWLAFVGHSGWVQYHMFQSGRRLEGAETFGPMLVRADDNASRSFGAIENDLAEARRHLQWAERLSLFDDPRIPKHLAWIAMLGGDLESADHELRRAIKMEPARPEVRYQLGIVDGMLGRVNEAVRQFEHASQFARRGSLFEHAIVNGAIHLATLEYAAEAVAVLQEASHRVADNDAIRKHLARLSLDHGRDLLLVQRRPREAIEYLESAVEHTESDGDIRADLAQALIEIGDFDRAESLIRANLDDPIRAAGSWFMLGELLKRQGRDQEAARCFQRAHEMNPRFPVR